MCCICTCITCCVSIPLLKSCIHAPSICILFLARGNECGDGAVRLRGGTRVGRVEICTEGRWGGICSHNWDSRDAAVVCRQLGYSSLGEWRELYYALTPNLV